MPGIEQIWLGSFHLMSEFCLLGLSSVPFEEAEKEGMYIVPEEGLSFCK